MALLLKPRGIKEIDVLQFAFKGRLLSRKQVVQHVCLGSVPKDDQFNVFGAEHVLGIIHLFGEFKEMRFYPTNAELYIYFEHSRLHVFYCF